MSNEKVILVPVLMVLLMTALAVIYSKYHSRKLFVEIQQLERQLDYFTVEWGQLQLEQTTLAETNRIERLAKTRLGLIMPQRDNIVFIRP